MSDQLVTVIRTPDGKEFTNKADAMAHMRRPKIEAALNVLTKNNSELTNWLIDHQETVEMAFEVGTIRRVTKSESKKLETALKAIVEAANPKFAFVADNHGAILDSFRWPSVKRMTPEEKSAAARTTLTAEAEGNESMADWIIANKDMILAGYEAGKEKREVNAKATDALAAYRAMKAAEKVEMEEAEKAGPEAVSALKAKREAAKKAQEDAAKAAKGGQ